MRNNSMFHRPMKLLAAGSLLFAALLAAQPAVAQLITGSRHDLTAATGTGTGSKLTGTTEICVFCHTPHGASTGAATGGLLWNRAAPAVGGYTLYTSTTVDSTFLQPGGNSNMCFSCHDGVTSIDNVVNRPGSGGFTAAGAVWGAPYTWAPAAGPLTGIAALTTDISNDHPVGAAYCGGFAASACRDPDFKLTGANQSLNRRLIDGTLTTGAAAAVPGNLTDQYWVDNLVGTAAVRNKTDMMLYPRTFTAPAGIFPAVECGSCHDPHVGAVAPAISFLRTTNAASAMCLSCHTK